MSMRTFVCLVTCFYVVWAKHDTGSEVTPKNITIQEKIKLLEKEKEKLFAKINDAIDDSVKTLSKANKSDAEEGISYLKELKTYVREINENDYAADNETTAVNYTDYFINNKTYQNIMKTVNSRRIFERDPTIKVRSENRIKDAIIEFIQAKMKDNKGKAGASALPEYSNMTKKQLKRLENKILVQKKLDVWLQKKEIEKAKIREYRLKVLGLGHESTAEEDGQPPRELCPDYGTRTSSRKGKKKSSGKDKLPCCRKCCKRSYMGCL